MSRGRFSGSLISATLLAIKRLGGEKGQEVSVGYRMDDSARRERRLDGKMNAMDMGYHIGRRLD
jgi:hypothetical protein